MLAHLLARCPASLMGAELLASVCCTCYAHCAHYTHYSHCTNYAHCAHYTYYTF